MTDFKIGDKVRFKSGFYDHKSHQNGAGTVSRILPNGALEIKIDDCGHVCRLTYISEELTKIDPAPSNSLKPGDRVNCKLHPERAGTVITVDDRNNVRVFWDNYETWHEYTTPFRFSGLVKQAPDTTFKAGEVVEVMKDGRWQKGRIIQTPWDKYPNEYSVQTTNDYRIAWYKVDDIRLQTPQWSPVKTYQDGYKDGWNDALKAAEEHIRKVLPK